MIRSARQAEKRAMTVDEVALRVKRMLEYDDVLSHVVVEGELTDLKRHVSGHVYFVLKGQNSSLNCVMFRSDAQGMLLWPRVGDRIIVAGAVRFYEGRGTVQIYARKMYPLGQSAAARAKEELRLRLEKEGLFAPARKRPLPRYPKLVACVTSATGAAVRDVMRQHAGRYPAAQLIIVPCLVQGIHAAESAALALRRAGAIPGVEVVLLVRGGGAKEDLNPFDDEELVREVARCPVPVVTGVGHEIDESLCDLAADMRQPTPTAAAAAVFPDRRQELVQLSGDERHLQALARQRIEILSRDLERNASNLHREIVGSLQNEVQRLDGADLSLERSARSALDAASTRLNGLSRALDNLAPANLARRGYSLVRCGKKPLLSASQAKESGKLTIQLLDGDVGVRVEAVTARG